MIPIEYDNSKLIEYDKFINIFIERTNSILAKGYIGKRKKITKKEARQLYKKLSLEQRKTVKGLKSSGEFVLHPMYILDSDSKAFFREVVTNLKKWSKYKPQEIKELCQDLIGRYEAFNNFESVLYVNTYYLFVQCGFDSGSFPKGELIDASNADVCPYCNRIYIKNVTGKDKIQIKGQLDHFLNKDTYPFLAILKYNLIPSCPYCNGPTGKHAKDAIRVGLVSPFDLKSADELLFKINILSADITDISKCADAMSLEIVCENPNMENNKRIFHIQELYSTHMDYAAEVYLKTRMIESSAYRLFVENLTKETFPSDPTELIMGFNTTPERFNYRPISKFQADIYKDIVRE